MSPAATAPGPPAVLAPGPTPAPPAAGPTESAASGTWLHLASTGAVRVIGVVVAQSATVTALLSYFGWVRTRALYEHFGVDSRALGLTTAEYLQNSVGVALPALIYAGLTALLVIGLTVMVLRYVVGRPRLALAATLMIALGGVGACGLWLAAFTGRRLWRIPVPLEPLTLGIGVLLLLAAGRLASRAFERVAALSTAAVATVLVVAACAFAWSWALYAVDVGTHGGEYIARTLGQRRAVSVYSVNRLALVGTGIKVVDLSAARSLYKVRYDGLRLIGVGASGDLFLVPKGWVRGRDPVIVLRADATIRLDLVAGQS